MNAQTPPVVVPGLEGMSDHLFSRCRSCRVSCRNCSAASPFDAPEACSWHARHPFDALVRAKVTSVWLQCGMACHEQASGASNGCLAWIRTMTKRSRVACATVTPRGKRKGEFGTISRAELQMTNDRLGRSEAQHPGAEPILGGKRHVAARRAFRGV